MKRATLSRPIKPAYPIQSVDKAFSALRLLVKRKRVRVGEAAHELHVSASTMSRLFVMLEYHGFAKRESGFLGYSIGDALESLSFSTLYEAEIGRVAQPFLTHLAARTSETIHLTRLHAANVMFVGAAEGSSAESVCGKAGAVLPAHVTAVGKALLAAMSHDELLERIPGERLHRWTARSIGTRDELERHLERVRHDGYALNFGECEHDVFAIAVPVRNRHGSVCSALSISFPPRRFASDAVERIVNELRSAAKAMRPQLL